MKYQILTLLIIFCLIEIHGLALEESVDKYVNECVRNYKTGRKSQIESKHIYEIKRYNEEGKKLLRCVLRSANLMDGSVVNAQIAFDVITQIYQLPDEHTKYIVDKCKRFRGLTNDGTLGMISSCIADHLIRYDF